MKYFYFLILFFICLISCSESQINEVDSTENPLYKKATKYLENGDIKNAFFYFNEAKDAFIKDKDSLRVGKCLIMMGTISTDNGDHFGAQEILLESLNYFNRMDTAHYPYLLSSFNTLGSTSSNMKEYVKAIEFFTNCLHFSKNSPYLSILENNLANAYRDNKNYDKALAIYAKAIQKVKENEGGFARLITNISITKWRKNPSYNPTMDLNRALQIRIKANDDWGKNSSYAHLTEYYLKNNKDSAFYYAKYRYTASKQINNPDDQIDALKYLMILSPANEIKKYFEVYQALTDSVQMARNTAKNQFALVRYETEKHKADNLILQKENTEKKYQIISLTIVISLILVGSFFWYKRRKQRIELVSQNAIRENQLRTSKKVHDVVANGLYRVMTEIENSENLNRDEVLDRLEDMYEKSRDLSYEELKYSGENFHEKIATLLKSFAGENIKVVIVGNNEELWKKVHGQVKYEVEHILQELMVNMKRHSKASNVVIRFEQRENRVAVFYTDNGVGMLPEQQFKNGLTNTGNRIISINGEINFDTKAEKGLKIQVSFPIS